MSRKEETHRTTDEERKIVLEHKVHIFSLSRHKIYLHLLWLEKFCFPRLIYTVSLASFPFRLMGNLISFFFSLWYNPINKTNLWGFSKETTKVAVPWLGGKFLSWIRKREHTKACIKVQSREIKRSRLDMTMIRKVEMAENSKKE